MGIDAEVQVKGVIKVEWCELGEGISGEYTGKANDIELLRFDVSQWKCDHWEAIDDASYCTQMPVSATLRQREKGLQMILGKVYELASQGYSIKKICEQLSWISLDSLEKGYVECKHQLQK